MSKVTEHKGDFSEVYREIRSILLEARNQAWRVVNSTMVTAYWNVGRIIVQREQKGREKAEYGKQLIEALSSRLQADFGKGFNSSNLWRIRAFYLIYPILAAVRPELSWTHYRLLLKVENPDARAFYEAEAVNARWSTRELDRQIHSLLFERLALSRDKEGVKALAHKGHEVHKPYDLVKDPFVLEFTGLRQDEHFYESDLENPLSADHGAPPASFLTRGGAP